MRTLIPVMLPSGRPKLATTPSSIGSVVKMATIGIVAVAALAARAEGSPPTVTNTATCRWTSSVASVGSRSYSPFAQRYSIAMFFPSMAPTSARPCRNAAANGALSSGERALRNPTSRIDACWAGAAIGDAAAPARNVMNSRRLIWGPRACRVKLARCNSAGCDMMSDLGHMQTFRWPERMSAVPAPQGGHLSGR